MPGSALLDTTAIIALFAGEQAAADLVARNDVVVSSTVLGELYFGALKSARSASNLTRIDELASSVGVLPCDESTARHYGRIKDRLRARGRPIPENDIWIAAVAMQHAITLVTRDEHFKEVDGLLLASW